MMMVLVGMVFGKFLNHEGEALVNGTDAFRKEAPERCLGLPTL